MRPLAGQVAWVTGASGGIGRAISLSLAEQGAHVAVGYHQNQSSAKEVATLCKEQSGNSFAVHVDVRSKSSVSEANELIHYTLGSPSMLIHAAGTSKIGLFQDMTEADYEEMMDVHVRSSFYLIQTVLPKLIQNKQGRIILISSIWGETGGAGEVVYSAAKGAQHGLVKALAKEIARSNITVNAVAPGAIVTPMLQAQLAKEEQEILKEEIPLGRLGQPQEVSSLVRYLCLPEAAYLTGQIIHVNGGWYT